MSFTFPLRTMPTSSYFPKAEVAEARKRVLLKRYLRRHGLQLPQDTKTDTLKALVRVYHQLSLRGGL